MEVASVAILVLVAVLTGALLPLLFQARATLRSAQNVLDDSRPKLLRTLDELQLVTKEVRALAADVEAARPQVTEFMNSLTGLTQTLNQLQSTVRSASAIGAAVGPAVAAAVQAFRAIRADDAADAAADDADPEARSPRVARAAQHRFTPGGGDEKAADSRHVRHSYE